MILLLAFGSVVGAGLPIGTALLGLAVGTGSLSLVAYVVDIPTWATVIGSMVGLAVGIDYALLGVRFPEELADGSTLWMPSPVLPTPAARSSSPGPLWSSRSSAWPSPGSPSSPPVASGSRWWCW